jgi:hypothetical protein
LHRSEDPFHDFIIVPDREEFPLRDVSQLRPRGQEDGRRKFWQQMLRKIDVYIKALE